MSKKISAPKPEQTSVKQERVQSGSPTSELHASAVYGPFTPQSILQLQKTIGNRATTRLIQQKNGTQPLRPSSPPFRAPDKSAPIQRVFRLQRDVTEDMQIRNVRFFDTESEVTYAEIGKGPGEDIVPYIWVAPLPEKEPSAAVAIRAKISFLSREAYEQGAWREDDSFNTDWIKLSEEERQKLDEIEKQKELEASSKVPTAMDEGGDEEVEDEMEIPSGKFEKGSFQVYMLEQGQKALGQSYTLASLVTGFTAQVMVLPTAKGELTQHKVLDLSEKRYTADQVWVQGIAISDERLNTQFGVDQESHTVSYTLSRNATIRLANRTASELMEYFIANFSLLESVMDSKEGQLLLRSVQTGSILQAARMGKLPIDRWQALLSTLIRIFYQVYQLSTAATYRRGQAKYHGEATARNNLDKDNTDVIKGNKTRATTKMATDAGKMLDVQFRLQSLGLREYAFAVHHWIDDLKVMYPELMASHGDKIVGTKLNTKLAPSFLKEINLVQEERAKKEKTFKPQSVTTVKDLMDYFDYETDAKAVQTKPKSIVVGGMKLPEIPLGELNTDFTASVGLVPIKTGIEQDFSFGFKDSPVSLFKVDAYTAGQVGIGTVTLGNKERPSTKFISSQKSHTVAWTLVRHQMMGFGGKTVNQLLTFIATNLKSLLQDIKNKDGLQVAKLSWDAIETNFNKMLPIHEWQALVSALMRWYLIAYSVAESASYLHTKELDRPLGHGEAWCMATLRRNEYSLASGMDLVNDKEDVIKAATGLMDAYISIRLDEKGVKNAYYHWHEALIQAFPTVMKVGGDKIRETMLSRKVGESHTFGSVLEMFK